MAYDEIGAIIMASLLTSGLVFCMIFWCVYLASVEKKLRQLQVDKIKLEIEKLRRDLA